MKPVHQCIAGYFVKDIIVDIAVMFLYEIHAPSDLLFVIRSQIVQPDIFDIYFPASVYRYRYILIFSIDQRAGIKIVVSAVF